MGRETKKVIILHIKICFLKICIDGCQHHCKPGSWLSPRPCVRRKLEQTAVCGGLTHADHKQLEVIYTTSDETY